MINSTIVIADDHPILLNGLREELEKMKFKVVGMAKNGLEALSLIQKLNPDIAILDIKMPLLNGFEVVEKCSSLDLKTKYIFLTSYSEVGFVVKSRTMNLSGYLLKDEPFSEVYKCIKNVLSGETYFSSKFNNIITNNIAPWLKEIQYLSPSERTILRLVSKGNSSKEIGENLSISYRTVKKHRENISRKLDLTSKDITLVEWAKEYIELLNQL